MKQIIIESAWIRTITSNKIIVNLRVNDYVRTLLADNMQF